MVLQALRKAAPQRFRGILHRGRRQRVQELGQHTSLGMPLGDLKNTSGGGRSYQLPILDKFRERAHVFALVFLPIRKRLEKIPASEI